MKFVNVLLLFAATCFSECLFAQVPFLPVTDTSGKTVEIDLSGLKRITVRDKDHNGGAHEYSGVLLADFLSKAGVKLGMEARKPNSSAYIVVKAKDDYKAIFALAEIDPVFTSNTILLADKIDGKDFPVNGPFEIIATADKVHARWINQIVRIEVQTAK